MPAPVHTLKKKEIVWLANHRCKHGMDYLSHWNCYVQENPQQEKVGYIDIECTNLNADFGFILCYCIKEAGTDKIHEGCVTEKDVHKDLDKVLLKKLMKDLEYFDRTIGFYSSKFDIPFIKTRCFMQGVTFPAFGSRYHKDLYYAARRNIKASSRRLENLGRIMLGKSSKTRIDNHHWIHASQGQKKSLAYVLDHCRKDVLDTEKIHKKFEPFMVMTDTSI
jgi:uncharacterized protein YprB with RNaseH-like and TPR domain